MNPQRFKQVEDEYFRFKGLFATGRMDRQQFEQALAQLIFEDEQGLRWMIGVDDAKWYVQDGSTWVQAIPPSGPTPVARVIGTPAPLPRQGSRFPVVILGSIIVLGCICGALGIWLAVSQGWLSIGTARPTTALILPTPYSVPTQYVLPTPFVIPTPFVPALPPATQPPVPTSTAPTLTPPTLTPTTTPTPTETPIPTATLTPTATPTPSLTPKPQGNCADPNARWENVVDGQSLDPYQAFIGTANGADFAGYVVEWQRPGNVLHRSTSPVTHGVIFVWNTYTVERGVYPVILTVTLKDGTTLAPCVVNVRVSR